MGRRQELNAPRHAIEASRMMLRIQGEDVERTTDDKPRFASGETATVVLGGISYSAKVQGAGRNVLTGRITSYSVKVRLGSRRWVHETVYPDQIQ